VEVRLVGFQVEEIFTSFLLALAQTLRVIKSLQLETSMKTVNHLALPAQTVPVAESDGLIPSRHLNSDVVIYFPLWTGAVAGIDTNQLMINGILVGDPITIPEEANQLSLSIPVATQLRQDGLYSVGYQATNLVGGVRVESTMITLRVDRTAPGATMLAAMAFPGASFGDSLTGRVPGYAGMEAGDLIQSICNGIHGPSCRVANDHLTDKVIELTFNRDFLQHLERDNVTITYHVTDRAGNRSILAQPVELTLRFKPN
jgi:hypothetical protein